MAKYARTNIEDAHAHTKADVIGALAVWRQNIKKMFLELFCDVLRNERPDFDLAVLLRRWLIVRSRL